MRGDVETRPRGRWGAMLMAGVALAMLALIVSCRKSEVAAPPALPEVRVAIVGADGHGKTTLLAAATQVLAQRGLGTARSYDDLAAAGGSGPVEVGYESGDRRVVLIDYGSHEGILAGLGGAGLDAMILVVAQAEGIRQQTRDQIAAAGQAEVPAVFVFQSKDDLVDDAELKDLEQSEIEQALVDAGLLAEADQGTWEGGSFQAGNAKVFRGSALRALEGDAGAGAAVGSLLDSIDRYAASRAP